MGGWAESCRLVERAGQLGSSDRADRGRRLAKGPGMDRRVQFDFDIEFANGGSLRGEGFRLDIDQPTLDDAALAEYIVRDLNLLMVARVTIRNKTYIDEPHKRQSTQPGTATR